MSHSQQTDALFDSEAHRIATDIIGSLQGYDPSTIGEDFFRSCIKAHPSIRKESDMYETLVASNKKQATFNLSHESDFNQKVDKLLHTKELADEQYKLYQELISEYESLRSECKGQNLPDLHLEEINKLEKENDELESDFIAGKITLSDFMSKYMDSRSKYYIYQLKFEKLKTLM